MQLTAEGLGDALKPPEADEFLHIKGVFLFKIMNTHKICKKKNQRGVGGGGGVRRHCIRLGQF
jgi:hypothetical protein